VFFVSFVVNPQKEITTKSTKNTKNGVQVSHRIHQDAQRPLAALTIDHSPLTIHQ